MTIHYRTQLARSLVLRAHAVFIGAAGLAGMVFDFRGAFLGLGPQGRVLAQAPHAAIGFVEAHGLAFILAVILWRAQPSRSLNGVGLATGLLLGGSNLIFWQLFVATGALATGYLTTSLHILFAVLHVVLAAAPARDAVRADTV
jgi:hypothetical protein